MVKENIPPDKMKQSLVNRYREILISKLTPQDLAEFQVYLRGQYGPGTGWNHENRLKFEAKLKQYFHEEVIRREISSIEAVLKLLTLEDLKN
jgi:hypothetical protein